jgi:hypothetical protein
MADTPAAEAVVDGGPLMWILGALDGLLAGDDYHGTNNPDRTSSSRPQQYNEYDYGLDNYDYSGAALSAGDLLYWPDSPGPSGRGNGRHRPTSHRHGRPAPGHRGHVTIPQPKPPTHDEIIAARVYETPLNERPSGQITGPGIIPQPGTKGPDTGASDSPIITNLVAALNPNETPATFDPHVQPGSPETWPGGLAPAQATYDGAACTGAQWRFDGETWSKSALSCAGADGSDIGTGAVDYGEKLRAAVNAEAVRVMNEQSNRERGPVLTGAMDLKTGGIFFGQNTGIPDPVHPVLEATLGSFIGPPVPFKGERGSHSEFNAINQGLFAREGSVIADFVFYSVRIRGSRALDQIDMCKNCSAILGDVKDLH